jgi:hypothetical protein
MDKIEKLDVGFLVDISVGSAIVEVAEKVNEIIDYLNQSQKQPEGELTAGDVFQLRRLEAFAEDYKKLKESMDKPEKQEEWREGLIDASYIYEGEANEDGSTKSIRTISFDYQKLENFISQLLSEKTFTKEELETLKSILEEEVEWELWVGGKELLEKISKLLKEKE